MFIVDGHCDTIQFALDKGIDIDDKILSFNLEKANNIVPMIQMTAAFVNPSYKNSFKRACDIIKHYERQIEKYPEKLISVKTNEDIEDVKRFKKIGLLLTIENGSSIEDKLENVDYFYQKGVRVMSITWNDDNLLGCGAQTKKDCGLTKFGKKYVEKLNKSRIIIDVSHSSQNTFWDVLNISTRPVVATHSCCKALCNHPRNLNDEQIKEIAKNKGIVGVCYCNTFLSENKTAGTKEIAQHIAHIANLVGIDFVGLGSDFDGLEYNDVPMDLRNIGEITNLIQALRNIGFNKNEINKIMGENWIRILKNELD